jgi:AcrR family transcriptional regulator
VTQAAKANVAAVNYHFGSREGMMGVVVVRQLLPIYQERLTRLEILEKKWGSKAIPLEELMDAYLRPVLGAVSKSELSDRAFSRLVGRMLALEVDVLPAGVGEVLKDLTARFLKVLGKALPTVPKDELSWRLHFVTGGLVHLLVQQDDLSRVSGGASGEPTMEVVTSRFIRFAVVGMREGVEASAPAVKKGPQVMFDF